jgi:hypothetical protein
MSDIRPDGPNIQLITGETVELSWQERSLCAQTDPEAFFPEKGGSTREAKRVCMSCDVRSECLDSGAAFPSESAVALSVVPPKPRNGSLNG